MLSKLKISARVLLLGILPLLVVVLVLLAAFLSAQQKDRLFNTLYNDHLAVLSDVMAVQQILQQNALQDIRKYRTGWASAEATEQAITTQLAQATTHWQAFVQNRPQRAEQDAYTALDQAFDKALKHYQEWISYAGSDALLVRILNESTVNNEVELRITAFAKLAEAFVQQQLEAGAAVRDKAERFTQLMVLAYIGGGVVLVLCISLLIWRIQRSVCRPLYTLRDMLQQVEKTSNLSLRADVQGSDEIAQASQALNQMMRHFEQLIGRLGNSAALLNEQAATVYQSSDDVNNSAQRQTQQASHLASAAEQMSASVRHVAQNARQASTAAKDAAALCNTGRDVASGSAEGIAALAEQLKHSAQVVAKLQQESGQISSVLDVIRKISEQTNLLALNAAIEAARAGEAGRGFSVVADEVRTLSANTQQATASIDHMISQLQQQANSAVTTIQQAHRAADNNVLLTQQAGERFTELAQAVALISESNQAIFLATEQQQGVAHDIAGNILLLNDDIRQLSAGASRSALASEQLNQLATQLDTDCQVFTHR